MKSNTKMELTEGSIYKIMSVGGKDKTIETQGAFRGFMSIGLDETGVMMELNQDYGEMSGKIRIIPIPVILAIDILEIKENEKADEDKGISHYVG